MNLRKMFAVVVTAFLVACGGGNKSSKTVEVLDPAKANTAAQTYISTLYSGMGVKGPVCMPEAVVDGYTQCSFTYQEAGSASDTPDGNTVATSTTKVGTILCNNNGCMEGDAPTLMSADIAPQGYAQSGSGSHGHSSISDDWLYWYLLFNSGGTSYHYNGWYNSTPSYGRTAYYSRTTVPSAQSRSYYSKNYSTSVKSSATKRYSSKTSRSSTSRSTTGSTSKKKSTSNGSPTSSSSKKTTSKKKNRTSGYGSSKRSSGYKPKSRSRSRRR